MFLDENNFYSVEEGSSGVLYLTDNLGNVDRFQPNCDLEKTQEYLYEFHELLTEQNNKVKNSFIIDNRDWYPSSVSTLYWQFFFQYVKYETLIEKWKSGQIHFRDIGPGRFNNLLCCLGYKNGNSQSPIKNIFPIPSQPLKLKLFFNFHDKSRSGRHCNVHS